MSASERARFARALRILFALSGWLVIQPQAGAQTPTVIAQVLEEGGRSSDQVVVAGSRLFFIGFDRMHGHELWVSDGTPGGTRMVKDVYVGDDAKNIRHLTAFGERVLFLADDGTGRFGRELWISDGTEAGTHMVTELVKGRYGLRSAYVHFASLGEGVMLFSAWHDIFRTDGTAEGTKHLAKIPGGDNHAVYSAHSLGEKVIFTNRYEIWVSDGTSEGTKELAAPGQIQSYRVHGDRVLVGTKELWATDGTLEGTGIVKDIFVGPNDSKPKWLRRAGDKVVFVANDGRLGYELYVTDGTEAGTTLLRDFEEGVDSAPLAIPKWLVSAQYDGPLVFFALDRGSRGGYRFELWRSDGTGEGTFPISDDFSTDGGMGRSKRVPYSMLNHDGRTYYLVTGRSQELWQTDGTADGTQKVPVAIASEPAWIARMGGNLYAVIDSTLVKIL